MKAVLGLDDASEDPMEKEQAGEVWEALMQLDRFILEQEHGQNRTHYGNMPFRPSLAEMLRASLFVARLHGAAQWDGKERKLFDLFFQARNEATPAG